MKTFRNKSQVYYNSSRGEGGGKQGEIRSKRKKEEKRRKKRKRKGREKRKRNSSSSSSSRKKGAVAEAERLKRRFLESKRLEELQRKQLLRLWLKAKKKKKRGKSRLLVVVADHKRRRHRHCLLLHRPRSHHRPPPTLSFNKTFMRIMKKQLGSSGEVKRKKVAAKRDIPLVDLSTCKYEVLQIALERNGWEEGSENNQNCHLVWTDLSVGPERLLSLKQGQKINHFYGMLKICRKKSLFRTLTTMRKLFPLHYKFFPRAFVLPDQLSDLLACFSTSKVRTYILKPDMGSQGRGVVLVQCGIDVRQAIEGYPGLNLLAQKYLTNPMLINGYKFDLRIYVLILSCDPVRLYLYREGIVRFCTERYQKPNPSNLSTSCMHLTNYALNKYNANFHFNTSATETNKGHKWALSSLFKTLSIRGYDVAKLHHQISKIVVMTILPIVPLLVHNYNTYLSEDDQGRTCFELLGMDVLIDQKCKPWLLEVNHSPSFSIDTPLDLKVKEALITDTLKLVGITPSYVPCLRLQEKLSVKKHSYGGHHQPAVAAAASAKRPQVIPENGKCSPVTFQLNHDFEQHEAVNLGKYDRIFPSDEERLQELYNVFLAGAQSAFVHSFDMKVKEGINKVRNDRAQENLAKEEDEKRKLRACQESRKKAQCSARIAALAALSTQANVHKIYNKANKLEPLSDRRVKADNAAAHCISRSFRSMEERKPDSSSSSSRRRRRLRHNQSRKHERFDVCCRPIRGEGPSIMKLDLTLIHCKNKMEEMTMLEKVEKWEQCNVFRQQQLLELTASREESDIGSGEREEESGGSGAATLHTDMIVVSPRSRSSTDCPVMQVDGGGGVLQMLRKAEGQVIESFASRQHKWMMMMQQEARDTDGNALTVEQQLTPLEITQSDNTPSSSSIIRTTKKKRGLSNRSNCQQRSSQKAMMMMGSRIWKQGKSPYCTAKYWASRQGNLWRSAVKALSKTSTNRPAPLKLPVMRQAILAKASSVASDGSRGSPYWDPPKPFAADEKSSSSPTAPTTHRKPKQQAKNSATTQNPLSPNTSKALLSDPKQEQGTKLTRRYHGRLPKLVRNESCFTIPGYNLPTSMAQIARFMPKTPKNHEQLSIVRCPLFQSPKNESSSSAPSTHRVDSHLRSRSRLNSDYISKARIKLEQIDQQLQNWPWMSKLSTNLDKARMSNPKPTKIKAR